MPVQIVKTPPAIRPVVLAEEGDRFRDEMLAKLKLYGQDMDARFEKAVEDGRITETIEAASSITFTISDPELELLRTPKFTNQKFDVKLDDTWFRLVGIVKNGDTLDLTFEDRIVAWLRGYSKARKAFRDQVTRAEFILMLLQEVREGTIRFYCPELHKIQPIRQTSATAGLTGGAGSISAGSVKWDFSGGATWYGGPNDSQDNNQPYTGIPNTVPGIAFENSHVFTTSRDWGEIVWTVVLFPNGKALALPVTDKGPANGGLDVNVAAVAAAGYSITQFEAAQGKTFRTKVCGKGEAGKRTAQALVNAPNGRTATKSNDRAAQKTADAARAPAGASGSTLVDGPVSKQIFVFFVANGFSEFAAAGFVGNFVQESGLNPNSGGGFFAQWGGVRLSALLRFARSKGDTGNPSALTQLQFVVKELQGGEGNLSAIKAARSPEQAADIICDTYERPRQSAANKPRRESEARKAYNQWKGTATGSGSVTSQSIKSLKRYAFQRGGQGEVENTWQCSLRLASEVGWRRFVYANTFMLISEDDLFASEPRATISRDTEGVDDIDFSIVMGHRPPRIRDPKKNESVAEMTITCRMDRWQAPPGSIIEVVDTGPANGLWLVKSKDRGYFDRDGTVDATKPMKKLPEPAPEVVEKNSNGAADSADAGQPTGAAGKVEVAAGANRAGVGMKPELMTFLGLMAGVMGSTVRVTTGTNHNQFVAGSNRQSLHWTGNAADLGVGGDIRGGGGDAALGNRYAAAAMIVCGIAPATARQWAAAGTNTQFNKTYSWNGKRVEIGWRTTVGGNHYTHVHVGVI